MSTEAQNENVQKVAGTEQEDSIESNEQFDFSQYTVHPLIADYPEMKELDLLDLQESIQVNGQIDPIIITENKLIVDGRNRFKICSNLKIEPHFKIEDLNEDEIQIYWISKNLQRNHLGLFQRACLAAEVSECYSEKIKAGKAIKISKRRQGKPLSEEEQKTTLTSEYLGKIFRVNRNYYQIAKHLKNYEPELFSMFKSGEKEKESEAENILNNNVQYLLDVPLKNKYTTFNNSNYKFSDKDKANIESIKNSKKNLKEELTKILDKYIEQSNNESLSAPQYKVQIKKLEDLGQVDNSTINCNIEPESTYSQLEQHEAQNKNVLLSEEEENQENLIQEFNDVDKSIKIKIVKLLN